MEEKLVTVKTVSLNNNCPECYNNQGLELTFKQKFKETAFFKSMTKNVVKELSCSNCNTIIYPARWNDDIDRVVAYHKKAFKPKPSSYKLKRLAWVILICLDLIILIFILYKFGVLDPFLQA